MVSVSLICDKTTRHCVGPRQRADRFLVHAMRCFCILRVHMFRHQREAVFCRFFSDCRLLDLFPSLYFESTFACETRHKEKFVESYQFCLKMHTNTFKILLTIYIRIVKQNIGLWMSVATEFNYIKNFVISTCIVKINRQTQYLTHSASPNRKS